MRRIAGRTGENPCGSASAQEKAMSQPKFPAGWDEERVRRVLEHYETQSDEEAVAEDEAIVSRRDFGGVAPREKT